MLVLFVCDVIGGFIGVSEGVNTWGEAWGFNTQSTVPLPVGAAQLVLAWLAARNVRPMRGVTSALRAAEPSADVIRLGRPGGQPV